VRLALLGKPVDHSRSPAIFAAAFAAAGIDGSYETRSVDADGVMAAFGELATGELSGINITMPHKALAFSLCDRVDEQAARAGSVNTVVLEGSQRVGYSTDIDGIRTLWRRMPAAGPVLILGSGGAAAAAAVALAERTPYISSRRPGAGRDLGQRAGVEVGELRWRVPLVGANVVNCTPLGMKGEWLPNAVVEMASGLFDLVYAKQPTPAITYVKGKGLPVVSGLDLLVSQAGFGFRLFTGVEPPLAAMRLAAEKP